MRESWAANLPDTVLLRFFIGGTDPAIVVQLAEEERTFGDIVFYDLPDEYDNLYLKVHVVFQWQQKFCAQAQFVLKTDDDTTVHVPRLLHHIAQRFKPAMNGTKAIFGYLWTSAPVERYGKWGVLRSVFAPDLYPAYCNGPSYLVSNGAVGAILARTPYEKAFKFEDVFYSGIVAEKAGVQKVAQGDVFYRGENVHVVFQWQQKFCAQAQFVLKTDDDTTVHVPRLLHHIAQRFKPAMNGTKAIFGYLWTSAPVERYGKCWTTPRPAMNTEYRWFRLSTCTGTIQRLFSHGRSLY